MLQRESITCSRVHCVCIQKQVQRDKVTCVFPFFFLHTSFACLFSFLLSTNAGRVCVPIDIETLDQFNPFDVPTVSKICHEFELQGTNGSEKKGST